MRKLLLSGLFLGCLMSVTPAVASNSTYGFTEPNYRDIVDTMLGFKVIDVEADPAAVNDYARIVNCEIFLDYYNNDFEWNKIRQALIEKMNDTNLSYYRNYNLIVPVELGRYDFENEFFPLVSESALVNVGVVNLFTGGGVPCGEARGSEYFPGSYKVKLDKPITIEYIRLRSGDAKSIVDGFADNPGLARSVYLRVRVTLTGFAGRGFRDGVIFNGKISAIDVFEDPATTIFIKNIYQEREQGR